MTSCPRTSPVKPWLVGSKLALSAAGMCAQCPEITPRIRTAKPIIPAAKIPKPQAVERRLRSLIHSIRATLVNP